MRKSIVAGRSTRSLGMRMAVSRGFKAAIAMGGVAVIWAGFPLFAGRWFYQSAAFIPITFIAALAICLLAGYACVREFQHLEQFAAWQRAASAISVIGFAVVFVAAGLFALMWGAFYGPAYLTMIANG